MPTKKPAAANPTDIDVSKLIDTLTPLREQLASVSETLAEQAARLTERSETFESASWNIREAIADLSKLD